MNLHYITSLAGNVLCYHGPAYFVVVGVLSLIHRNPHSNLSPKCQSIHIATTELAVCDIRDRTAEYRTAVSRCVEGVTDLKLSGTSSSRSPIIVCIACCCRRTASEVSSVAGKTPMSSVPSSSLAISTIPGQQVREAGSSDGGSRGSSHYCLFNAFRT